jgi:hypothetical protein
VKIFWRRYNLRTVRKTVKPVTRRPKLRTLTAGNTVERFRSERNVRKRTKKGLFVLLIVLIAFGLFGAWKSGVVGGVAEKIESSAISIKTKVVSAIPDKAKKKTDLSGKKNKRGLIAWIQKKLPFGKGDIDKMPAKAVVLLELDGLLYPVGSDLLIQKSVKAGYYDLPILKVENWYGIGAGQIMHNEKFVFDLIDAFEKRAPETAKVLAMLKSIRSENLVVLTFTDSPSIVRVGRGRSIEEQVDNIVLLRSNICPDSTVYINLEHSGVAFVTMEE